jgi:spermidine synthase
MAAQRNAVSGSLFWIASLMFFLSGGTGLAYQVIWFKRFAHVWGSSSLAFASVGASFLFGLGLGAYLIGRFADRMERPLRWYGVAEIAIGVLALLIPFQIAWLIQASAGFYPRLPDDPFWRYMVQFGITLLVVGPPTVLMGGTLPLLIRQLTARDGSLDQATGWLYAINTFGAAAGCYLTGFHFLPAFGLFGTNVACAFLNIAIGVAAVIVSMQASVVRAARPAPATPERAARAARPGSAEPSGGRISLTLLALYIAVGLSGLGALVLEMTWSRQLALVLGGSTYAYTSTLFVVLLGIALGSLIFHSILRPAASSPWLPFVVILVLAVSCLVGILLLPKLSVMLAEYRPSRNTLMGNGFVCVLASLILELVPAIAMGILFPLFVHLTHESAAKVGRAVGDVYAWNTLGSIFGASLTAVVLFPWIGTAGSVALATTAYLIALVLVLPVRSPLGLGLAATTLIAGAGIVWGIQKPRDPLYTNMGMYMYGNQIDRFLSLEKLYFAEGASSNVLVTKTNNDSVNLRVNGKVDASDGLDMHTQLGLAYFPRIFKHDARDVLVIGFGSGTTSGASLLFPETNVTCCEIEPAVYRAAPHFGHVNHRPYEKTREFLREQKQKQLSANQQLTPEDEAQIESEARFRIIFGDGRTTLQGSDKKFDLIISEPSNPWLAGVSNLFTEEFFEAAHKHLNEGGVLAQWIQTYNFTWADYLMIVRTLKTRFKHCGVVVLAGGADTILLASDKPLRPTQQDLAEMRKLIDASEEVSADLRKWYGTTDPAMLLMKSYKADDELLVAAVEKQPNQFLNNDLNLRLEFDAPLHLFQQLPDPINATVQMSRISDDDWIRNLGTLVGIEPNTPEYHVALADQSVALKNDSQALELYQKAIQLDSRHAPAYIGISAIHLRNKNADAAIALLRDLLKIEPENLDGLRALATAQMTRGQRQEAVELWKKVVELDPKDFKSLMQLSQIQLSEQKHAEAVATLARAHELQPDNVEVIAALGNEQMLLKNYTEAVKHFKEALRLRPISAAAIKASKNQTNTPIIWANNLAWLLATAPEAELRNGEEAVYWAKQACEATNYKPEFVDTLAAAYAEAGNFDEAVRFCQQFLDQSQFMKPEMIQAVKQRLKLYQTRQPYRES